jgi:hypothetical protein
MAEKPKYRKGSGPNQLPQGGASSLNEVLESSSFAPAEPDLGPEPGAMNMFSPEFAGLENVLFADTDRPEEPITAGAPFGPGPGPRPASGDDTMFRKRVATELLNAKGVSSSTKLFASKLYAGD